MMKPVRHSLLDLSPIVAGSNAAESFRNTLDLARRAERWGYHRYWLAEHHNIPGVASAATSVVIGHVAGGTRTMRVGAGGIMLPNHAPLVIAEQFGTLESLYPGRIDLGVGRAPGGDVATTRALRRYRPGAADSFPEDLLELMDYFHPSEQGEESARSRLAVALPTLATPGPNPVRAIPGHGLDIPIYLLGSSDFSAQLAALLGLPFAFASHFAPEYLQVALGLYRAHFRPSAQLAEPYVIVGVNVFAAETDGEARRLFTSLQQQFLNLTRGHPREIPPPVDSMDELWQPHEKAHVEKMTRYAAVGSPETLRGKLEQILAETGADELMTTASMPDHAARLRSFEITADVVGRIRG
jgi:luciferase family oxidoreductase group 1